MPEQWKEKIKDFKTHSVVKFPRIFQSLFYLLKYKERPVVCDKGTNKLLWKKAMKFLNDDLFGRMGDYWPIGQKEESYKEYEKLRFIQDNLAAIKVEEVDEYSVALGKLYRWVLLALEVRFEDVKLRRSQAKQLRTQRETAIAEEKARMEKRLSTYEDKKAAFDEQTKADMDQRRADYPDEEIDPDEFPDFDAEEFYAKFDEDNPQTYIPEEVTDDVDHDFNLTIPDTPRDDE